MKNLTLFCIAIFYPLLLISQVDLNDKVPLNKNGAITFQKVIEIDATAKEIFNKNKEWFLNHRALHKAFATTINREGGRVSGKGKFEFTKTLLTVDYNYRIHFVLSTDSKEGKSRITLNNFIIEEKGSKTNKWKPRKWAAEKNISDEVCYNKKGKIKPSCKKFKEPILAFVAEVFEHFENALTLKDDF